MKIHKISSLLVILLTASLCELGFAQPTTEAIETDRLSISLPASIELWCGYREVIPIVLTNKTSAPITAEISAKTQVNIFIEGITREPYEVGIPFAVGSLLLPPGKSISRDLELQSLRVGRYYVQLIIDDRTVDIEVISEPKERGSYFMYRCWREGPEFFETVFSNGVDEISQDQKRDIARDYLRGQSGGLSREEATWETAKHLWELYPKVEYRKQSDWERVWFRKKNQQTEKYGFQFIDIDDLGWSIVERQRGKYQWEIGDFLLDLSNQFYHGEPFVRIECFPEWTKYQRGPSGKFGFYDAENELLIDSWGNYCEALAERYDGDGIYDAPGSPVIRHFILPNEPNQFWLSVNFDRDGRPLTSGEEGIWTTRWYEQTMQRDGLAEAIQMYIDTYGDILFAITRSAAEAIHRANPRARAATPQFIHTDANLAMFEHLLERGIGEYIDAWGLHPGNSGLLHTLWKPNPEAPYVVEDAANQAPPFEVEDLTKTRGALDRKGQYLETARPVSQIKKEFPYMGKLWRTMIDQAYSDQLESINELFAKYGVDLPFWVTEMIILGPLASNRRENLLAALHEWTIVFHQKVEISTMASVLHENILPGNPISHLPDPIIRELIVDIGRAIGGAQSAQKFDCQLFAPGESTFLDYRWTVYKLFTRGDEDIIALWNNSGKEETVTFTHSSDAKFRKVRLIEFDADEREFKQETSLTDLPREISIKPLKEFYFLSVESDLTSFGWLEDIQRKTSPEEAELIALLSKTKDDIQQTKQKIRNQRQGVDMRELRAIPGEVVQAEDALIMGDYDQARDHLESIQRTLSRYN
jgi:hypothetical protein